ncbi:hypothetical protein PNEG_02568 [Pneumocystis murina B123]|uniref:Metallo-beta-lactamase domain-containing protein n=1 Tax=Pneumocystis murina (strain B123) TaxID=1069680 RepID=M7NKR4_PNEMU|nr:hypothetical protein PNEG_02568 [Pneumocystis murina B123]EMR09233.1 hypothetical protein PNEG_02568 [Pneumocystis murina B123]
MAQAKPVELIFLGTGTSGSVPSIHCLTQNPPTCSVCIDATYINSKNRRRNTSAVILIKDCNDDLKTLVIDCGKTFYEATLEYFPRYSLRKIDALLITHAHADAINGLDDLRGWTLKGLIQDYIDIYLTSETMDTISTTFPYCVYPEKATGGGDVPSFRFHIIDFIHPFIVESCGNITIYPLKVQHGVFQNKQGNKLPFYILGYRINNLSYISDVSVIPDETIDIIKGCEFLVLDALKEQPHLSHFSIPQALDFLSHLSPNLPKKIFFIGFDHSIAHDDLEKRLSQEIQHGILKNTCILPAYDGMRISLID